MQIIIKLKCITINLFLDNVGNIYEIGFKSKII